MVCHPTQMGECNEAIVLEITLNKMLSDIIILYINKLINNSLNDSMFQFTNISLALLCLGVVSNITYYYYKQSYFFHFCFTKIKPCRQTQCRLEQYILNK